MSSAPPGFGALLVGSWINSLAYAVVLQQAWRYFSSFQADYVWLKALVGVVLALDTACIVGQCGYVYVVNVSYWGDPEGLIRERWPTVVTVFLGPCIMTLVNLFLTYRFYGLSKNRTFSAILVFVLVADFGLAMFVGAGISIPPTTLEGVKTLNNAIIVATVMYSVIDLTIAASMIWQLMRMRTPFKQTRTMITRLVRLTIESGTATFMVSLIILIIFLADPTLIFLETAISWLISHFYALTLLFNLNVREQLRGDGTRTHSESRNRSQGLSLAGGIQVTHHRTVVSDSEQAYDMKDVSGKASKIASDMESGY